MPNRKQIIAITVLGIIAFLIGYFKDSINLSMGKGAEIQGPVAPNRNLTLEEKKLVGTYERKRGANTFRFVFLDNGLMAHYSNGEKDSKDLEWSLVGDEIHMHPNGNGHIYRINPDNSITKIANIRNGIRIDLSKERQHTHKKIN